ncbi:MAG: hypothetical protein KC910_23290, partial [Candidatus Eremiobacteraeota bacterium]|nr:hypothetical protein [Candidatus Eremiobacteraeota bacterium]
VNYARESGGKHLCVPVHHSWTSLEDLLGRPEVVLWLREAATAERRADKDGVTAVPYYLILDDCNLAAIEDYLAEYLAGQCEVMQLSNLYVLGTVHQDGWALTDWILDRAQLIEVEPVARDLLAHLGDAPYRGLLLQCWQALKPTAPFAFRTTDQIKAYLAVAEQEGMSWEAALDEQMVQKLLPRVKAETPAGGDSLGKFLDLIGDRFPLARAYAERLLVEAGNKPD